LKDRAEIGDDEVAEHIKEIVPYLEKYDLVLGLENHGKHATGKQIMEIVDRVDSPRVVINYDTANVIYYGNVDVLEDMKACVDKIGHIHLKDKAGVYNEWNFPAIGKGTVNFPAIIDLLEKAGNDCPLSIEIEFTKDGAKDLAEVDQAVRDSYRYLKKLGLEF